MNDNNSKSIINGSNIRFLVFLWLVIGSIVHWFLLFVFQKHWGWWPVVINLALLLVLNPFCCHFLGFCMEKNEFKKLKHNDELYLERAKRYKTIEQEMQIDTIKTVFGVEIVEFVDTMHHEISDYVPNIGARMKYVMKKLLELDWFNKKPISMGNIRKKHVFTREFGIGKVEEE